MDPFDSCRLYDFIVEAICMGILCVFGFCGNSLSMACLMKDKSKTATPFLLVSLEVADTLFLLFVLVLRVLSSLQLFTRWFPDVINILPYLGKYIYPCALMAETGTVYLTILVTVNRYISVCKPYEATDLCSIKYARKHVLVVTVFSILFHIPRFFEYEMQEAVGRHKNNNTVPILVPTEMEKSKVYQIIYKNVFYFFVMFLVPLVTLIILNYKLIKALGSARIKRVSLRGSSKDTQCRSEDDITKILIVVVLVFVVCQTPALITQILVCVLDIKRRHCPNAFFYYERFSDLMVVFNSSVNFMIYCFCSKRFRQILFQLLGTHTSQTSEPTNVQRQGRPTSVVAKSAWIQGVENLPNIATVPTAV